VRENRFLLQIKLEQTRCPGKCLEKGFEYRGCNKAMLSLPPPDQPASGKPILEDSLLLSS